MNEDLRLKRLSFYNKLMVDSSLDLKGRESTGAANEDQNRDKNGSKSEEEQAGIKESLNKIIDDSFAMAQLKRSKSLAAAAADSAEPIDSKSLLDKIFGAYDTQVKTQTLSNNSSGGVNNHQSAMLPPKVRKFSQSISFDADDDAAADATKPAALNSANLSTNRKLEEFRRIVESSQLQHIQTNNLLKQIGEGITISSPLETNNSNGYSRTTGYSNSASSVNKDSQSTLVTNKSRKGSIESSHSLLNFDLLATAAAATPSSTLKSELNSFRNNESSSAGSSHFADTLSQSKLNASSYKMPYMSAYNVYDQQSNNNNNNGRMSKFGEFSSPLLTKQESVESFDDQPVRMMMPQPQLQPTSQQPLITGGKHLSSNGSSLNTSPTSTSSVESMKKAAAITTPSTPDFMLDTRAIHSNYEIKPPETPRSKVPSFRKNLVKVAHQQPSTTTTTTAANVDNVVAFKQPEVVQQDDDMDLNATQLSERVVETVVKNAVNKLNGGRDDDMLDLFFNSKQTKQKTVNAKDSVIIKKSSSVKKSQNLKSSTEMKKSSAFRLQADPDQNEDYTLNNNSNRQVNDDDNDDDGSDTFDMFSSQESLNKEPGKLDSITNSNGEKVVFGKKKESTTSFQIADKLDLRIDLGELSDSDDYVDNRQKIAVDQIEASGGPSVSAVVMDYPPASAESMFRSSRSTNTSARQQIKPQNIPNLALDLMDDDKSQSVAASLAKSMCKEIDYQQEMELICKKHQIVSIQPSTTTTNSTTATTVKPALVGVGVNKSKSFKSSSSSNGNNLQKSSTSGFITEQPNNSSSTTTTPRYSSRASPRAATASAAPTAVTQPHRATSHLQIVKINDNLGGTNSLLQSSSKQKIINSTMNQENLETKSSYFMKAPSSQNSSRPNSGRKLEPIKFNTRANSPNVGGAAGLSRPPSSLVSGKDKKQTNNNLMRKSVAGPLNSSKVTVFSYLKNEEDANNLDVKSQPSGSSKRRQQHWKTSSNIVRSSSAVVGMRNRSPSPSLVSRREAAKTPLDENNNDDEDDDNVAPVVSKSTALFLNYSKLVEIESNFNKEYEEIMANADAPLKSKQSQSAEKSQTNHQMEINRHQASSCVVDWLALPDEIWLNILENLSHKDLVRLGLTCKALYRLYQDNTLWRRITLKYKYDMCDEWLNWIGRRRPSELNIVQCSGTLTLYAISEMFKMIGTNLHTLNLSRCSNGSLSGDNFALQASIRCPNVTSLDLSWTLLSNQTLKLIADSFTRIESINLSGCNMIQEDGFNVLLQKHGESIRNLEISGCIHFSPNCVLNIGVYCRNIERLNLSNCHRMTNESVIEAAPHWLKLKFLDLRGIKAIKNNCVSILVRRCLHLEGLALADCIHIGDASVLEISTYKPNIKYLDLNGCKKIGDNSVRSIANFCAKLESLNLKGTTVTDNGLVSLSNGKCRVSLEELNLSYLPISELVLGKILKNYERLKSIYLYGCYNIKRVDEIKKSIDLRSCLTINI